MMLSLCSCATPSDGDASDESSTKAPAQEDIKNFPSKFSFGKNTENTYRSEFLGLTVTTPDGWKLSSDEATPAIQNKEMSAITARIAMMMMVFCLSSFFIRIVLSMPNLLSLYVTSFHAFAVTSFTVISPSGGSRR